MNWHTLSAEKTAENLKTDLINGLNEQEAKKRLEASGCVSSRTAEYNSRLRKYYSITDSGRERIREFLSDWQDIEKTYNYIKEEWEG